MYGLATKRLGLSPRSCITRGLQEPRLDLARQMLGPDGTKPLAIALLSNTKVFHLDLKDNFIGDLGADYIAQVKNSVNGMGRGV